MRLLRMKNIHEGAYLKHYELTYLNKSGKEKVFGFFVGKMMRELKGKASPDAVREALVKEVERRKNL